MAASQFLLDIEAATKLVAGQVKAIKKFWKPVCDQAALSEVDRNFMWRRQFLNPFAFVDAPEAIAELAD
jgi:serine/threonine-protein kinase HipA